MLNYIIFDENDPKTRWAMNENQARLMLKNNAGKFALKCEVYDEKQKLIDSGDLEDFFNEVTVNPIPPTAIKAPKTWPDMNVKEEPDKFVVSDDQMSAVFGSKKFYAGDGSCATCEATSICIAPPDTIKMFCNKVSRKDGKSINWKLKP
jgi:hypothetical protein